MRDWGTFSFHVAQQAMRFVEPLRASEHVNKGGVGGRLQGQGLMFFNEGRCQLRRFAEVPLLCQLLALRENIALGVGRGETTHRSGRAQLLKSGARSITAPTREPKAAVDPHGRGKELHGRAPTKGGEAGHGCWRMRIIRLDEEAAMKKKEKEKEREKEEKGKIKY